MGASEVGEAMAALETRRRRVKRMRRIEIGLYILVFGICSGLKHLLVR